VLFGLSLAVLAAGEERPPASGPGGVRCSSTPEFALPVWVAHRFGSRAFAFGARLRRPSEDLKPLPTSSRTIIGSGS